MIAAKLFTLSVLVFVVHGQESTVSGSTSSSSSTASPPTTNQPSTTTIAPELACRTKSNTSCSECLKVDVGCYYCSNSKKCGYYPYKKVIPKYDDCSSFSEVYWSTCTISLQVSVILIGSTVGVIVIALTICCCCCCRKRRLAKWRKTMANMERDRQERKAKSEERRKERQSRTDEIRRKYGLIRDDNPYQKFDNPSN